MSDDDQPSLFDDDDQRARARRTDPETSHEAAASVTPKLRASQEAVLYVLRAVGPCTDMDLVEAYERYARRVAANPLPWQSQSGIRTRRNELVTQGRVADTGRRRVLPSGRRANVWTAR